MMPNFDDFAEHSAGIIIGLWFVLCFGVTLLVVRLGVPRQ